LRRAGNSNEGPQVTLSHKTRAALEEGVYTALAFTFALAAVNRLSDREALRRRPFGQIVLVRSGLYLGSMLTVCALTILVFRIFIFSADEFQAMIGMAKKRFLVSMTAWVSFSIVAINFGLEVRRKVGPGNLWALFTGRYHRPRSEDRLFLFLDLQGSTTIAEKLGHEQFSQFLRHCYHDLTDIVLESGAAIYQYVGDEVVLSWEVRKISSRSHCLDTFFAFERKLRQKGPIYEEKFGVAPVFRGGISQGAVTATEVGDIKREIAYHGDVLNTSARLLELCNTYDRPLLISGRVRDAVSDDPEFLTTLQGEVTLRGKTESIPVYGVEPRSSEALAQA
jgi:adenylate cyclase